jgi:hypothetical protein
MIVPAPAKTSVNAPISSTNERRHVSATGGRVPTAGIPGILIWTEAGAYTDFRPTLKILRFR